MMTLNAVLLVGHPELQHRHRTADGRMVTHAHRWGDLEHVHDSNQWLMFGQGWETAEWIAPADLKPPS